MSCRLPVRALILAFLLAVVTPVQADPVSRTIPFMGILSSPSGQNQNGQVPITLSLYPAATGGTALWSESQTVTATNGVFSTTLGKITPFPASLDFSQAYFVGISVNTEAEMTPRLPLTSVPYALYAGNVANDPSLLAKVSGGAMMSSGTNIGVGTTSPLAKLDIQGGAAALGENDPGGIAIQYFGGGYRHFIRTRHNSHVGALNAFDFFVNNSDTPDGSSAPGVGNIQNLTLDSGRVGIGTLSPLGKLDVKGNAYVDPSNFGGTPTLSLAVGDTDTGLNSAGDGQLDLFANNVNTMSVRAGHVGIDTSSPGARLHVNGGVGDVGVFAGDLNPFGSAAFETNLSTPGTHAWFAENGNKVFSITNGGQGFFGGLVESAAGFKFPDGTTQTTAAGGIADNSVTSAKLAADAASLNKVSGGALSTVVNTISDQVQATGGLSTGFGRQPQDYLQTFTAGYSGTLTGLDLVIDYRYSEPLTLSVGVAGGAVLTSQPITPGSGLTVKHFDLSTPVQIVGGQRYYWEVNAPGLGMSMAISNDDVYAGGASNIDSGKDFVFATYMANAVLSVTGRLNLAGGTIQRGGSPITATTDMGLYSLLSNQWMRFVTNGAPIHFFTDPGSDNSGGTDAVVINTNFFPRLDVSGRVRSAGYDTTSDIRYKQDVGPIPDPLGVILSLRGVTFDWRRDGALANHFPPGRQVGFIAQEVEKVLPEVVSTDSQGYKSVAYQNIVPVLVEAVKTLKADNDGKAAEIAVLQQQNAAMERRLNRLEQLALHSR